MPARDVRDRLPAAQWQDYVKIASIRNPFDKAVSWYWFIRSLKPKMAKRDPIPGFRKFLRVREARGYFGTSSDIDWRTCFIDGTCVIDRFIKLESLHEDLTSFASEIGATLDLGTLPVAKSEPRTSDRYTVAEYFDEPTADILRRGQNWIFELGGYSLDPGDAVRVGAQVSAGRRTLRGLRNNAKKLLRSMT